MKIYQLILLFAVGTSPLYAQSCNSAILPTTPKSRFLLFKNGTAIDKQTGLQWMRCALGQTWNGSSCSGDSLAYTWQSALNAAEASEFAGYKDWRMPNLKELASIVELACDFPAINVTVFSLPISYYCSLSSCWNPQPQDVHYWSSTVHAFDSKLIGTMDFGNADDTLLDQSGSYSNLRYSGGSVRLVRRGL